MGMGTRACVCVHQLDWSHYMHKTCTVLVCSHQNMYEQLELTGKVVDKYQKLHEML